MKFIREKDLNDKNVDYRLAAIWKARYYGIKFNICWTKMTIITERIKAHFNITLQELTILESILWAERITISSLSVYLDKKISNISRVISSLIERNILVKSEDKTLNITKEFAKDWYSFFETKNTRQWLNESLEETIPKLEMAISMMKDALEKIKGE